MEMMSTLLVAGPDPLCTSEGYPMRQFPHVDFEGSTGPKEGTRGILLVNFLGLES